MLLIFPIKPVRRNGLSNLWQHAWRRHGISKLLTGGGSIVVSSLKQSSWLQSTISELNEKTYFKTGCVYFLQTVKFSELLDPWIARIMAKLSRASPQEREESVFVDENDEGTLGRACQTTHQ